MVSRHGRALLRVVDLGCARFGRNSSPGLMFSLERSGRQG